MAVCTVQFFNGNGLKDGKNISVTQPETDAAVAAKLPCSTSKINMDYKERLGLVQQVYRSKNRSINGSDANGNEYSILATYNDKNKTHQLDVLTKAPSPSGMVSRQTVLLNLEGKPLLTNSGTFLNTTSEPGGGRTTRFTGPSEPLIADVNAIDRILEERVRPLTKK